MNPTACTRPASTPDPTAAVTARAPGTRARFAASACLLMTLCWPIRPAAQTARAAPVTRAKASELFAANCAICHGPDGAGTPLMPDLAFKGRGNWKHGSRPQDVVATITNGVPTTAMLPFKGRLTPADITALAALVRSFDKTIKPAGTRGKR